jgi:trimeric autotransporter adhesin
MTLNGRNTRLEIQSSAKTGCDDQSSSKRTAPSKTSYLLRLLMVCAAVSTLAACEESSSTESTLNTGTVATVTAKPAVSLVAIKSSVEMGSPATLQWSTQDAQSCTASGGWNGSQPTSGTATTDPLTTTTNYTLTCTGPGGAASQSAEVVVISPAPTVALSVSSATVSTGGTTTLNWNAQNATSCTASGGWKGAVATNGTWTSEALTNTTEYELTCTGSGGSAVQTATVSVFDRPPVITLSANPSSVSAGSASTITWTTQNATACSAAGSWSGSKSLSGSQSTGAMKSNATFAMTCTGSGGSATQSATVSVKSAAPSVSITATPSTVASGASSALRWSTANATSCVASGAWSGGKATNGTQSTGVLSADATYTLTCSGPGGSAAQSATISIKAAAPTVTLSVGPSAITSGSSATLNWSATNATACTASGAWSGSKAVHGSQSTGALSANSTYVLSCSGDGGTASQSATVTVSAKPTVKVSIGASPSTVASGASSMLTWSSVSATACTASGAWSGTKATSGSSSTGALTAGATFAITCTGSGGSSATQTVTVSVSAPSPTVSLTASPSTVASGSASTLSWSSSNATSCNATGAWSGSKTTTGSFSTGALKAAATYGLSCTGSGGTASQSATVSVSSPAPVVTLKASPSSVTSGSSSTLSWSATNATSCTASGAWSGAKAVSGSLSTGALSANATYGLVCSGTGGSANQSVTVSVTAGAPAVTLSASPSTVKSGATSMLTWSSSNDTACTASGGWSGSMGTSGSRATTALKATTKYMLTCTGSGGTATQAATVTVSSTPPSVTISASPTSVSSGGSSTLTWSSTNATACTAAGGWSGAVATAGSKSTGAISTATTYSVTCTGTGGSASQSATVSVTSTAAATSGQVSRPSYNTGPGFFVLNGKLYDANGNEFRIRGVDRNHYDSISQPGISKTGANAVRIMVATNYGASVARLVSIVQNDHINYKEVPIVMTTETPAGADTSCSSDATVVAAAVANWVATASSWTPLDKYTIINIANEWGPTNSTVWRDSNISAIAKMRAAGYMGTLMIDAGGCGQDMEDLVNYSGAVFSSDPQKNVIFALHAYYNTTPANVASRFQQLASLAASTGAAYAVTEFGPGRNIGPSPTLLTPGEVITNAEANGLGWCAWAWDDNDLGNGASDDNWFSMTYNGPGIYTTAADLTIFGTDVVLNSTYGLSVLAKPATIF